MTEKLLRPVRIDASRLTEASTAAATPAREGYINRETGEIIFVGDGLEKVKAAPSTWVQIPVYDARNQGGRGDSEEALLQGHMNGFLASVGLCRQ
jgi:hypothetical protein